MNCPCGASRDQLVQYYATGETDFCQCQACGCVFREKFPDPEELEDIYRQAYEEDNIVSANTNQESGDFAARSYAGYLARHFVKPDDRILDYGAGSGGLVAELHGLGLTCDGVEFAESAREYCLVNRGYALHADLDTVPDEYYQVISMIEVIEHLTDLSASLKEIHRVLAPGGRLFITTPNRLGVRARIERGNWREARKKFHLFLFDWHSIRFHLQRAAFVRVEQILFSPFQKDGWKFAVYARAMQSLGMPGTLCVTASKE